MFLFKKSSKKTGDLGERIAEKYLRKQGYKIIEKNFRIRGGEIDLITKDKDTLVFIEVKTKASKYYSPFEEVNYFKKRFLKRAAQIYILKKKPKEENFRFDVVSIEFLDKEPKIEHFKNIEI